MRTTGKGQKSTTQKFMKLAGRVKGPEDLSTRKLGDNGIVAEAITRDPETMHGTPVFRGTRVPVQNLFDYLEGGETLEDFLGIPHRFARASHPGAGRSEATFAGADLMQ